MAIVESYLMRAIVLFFMIALAHISTATTYYVDGKTVNDTNNVSVAVAASSKIISHAKQGAPVAVSVNETPAKRLTPAEQRAAAEKLAVRIPSSIDGTEQLVIWYCPENEVTALTGTVVPLLIFLHSWSGGFEQGVSYIGIAKKMGWALVVPDFRGPNNKPEACASELASQNILDAVVYAKKHTRIDPSRIYLLGNSGGGHMALVMAARAPKVWAGVSAWVPISDLAAWHAESVARQRLGQPADFSLGKVATSAAVTVEK